MVVGHPSFFPFSLQNLHSRVTFCQDQKADSDTVLISLFCPVEGRSSISLQGGQKVALNIYLTRLKL